MAGAAGGRLLQREGSETGQRGVLALRPGGAGSEWRGVRGCGGDDARICECFSSIRVVRSTGAIVCFLQTKSKFCCYVKYCSYLPRQIRVLQGLW